VTDTDAPNPKPLPPPDYIEVLYQFEGTQFLSEAGSNQWKTWIDYYTAGESWRYKKPGMWCWINETGSGPRVPGASSLYMRIDKAGSTMGFFCGLYHYPAGGGGANGHHLSFPLNLGSGEPASSTSIVMGARASQVEYPGPFIGWLTVYVDPTAIGTAKDTAHIFEDMNPEGTYNVWQVGAKNSFSGAHWGWGVQERVGPVHIGNPGYSVENAHGTLANNVTANTGFNWPHSLG
jgi:hypothetical protein